MPKEICQLCKEEVKSLKALAIHINLKHSETTKEEYFINFLSINNEHICSTCGGKNTFKGFAKRFTTYCSNKCMTDSKITKNKRKKTIKEKYGVENVSQIEDVKEKKINTNLKNNGVEYALQSKIFIDKYKNTMMCRHGVINPMHSEILKKKLISNTTKIFYQKLLTSDRLQNKVIPMFTPYEYNGVYSNEKYNFKCIQCNNIFQSFIYNGRVPRCLKCYPYNTEFSKQEKEVCNFIKSILPEHTEIITNSKSIISPYELDIYLPDYKFAIEFNGLYWHSELQGGKDKTYHLNKTNLCKEKGITLIHIFEDEWLNKTDIIKSMIKHKLNLNTNKIYARKCEIKNVPFKIAMNFLNDNHIQGQIISNKNIGLYYCEKLVSLFSYSKSRYNTSYDWELLRYCNLINTNIVGGFSKLLKYFKLHNVGSLITYADLRYSSGNVYTKNGFEYIKTSEPNYFYLFDYFNRQSRLKFQKHILNKILENYDITLSEWENMKLNNYDRIWDCGNNVYVLN